MTGKFTDRQGGVCRLRTTREAGGGTQYTVELSEGFPVRHDLRVRTVEGFERIVGAAADEGRHDRDAGGVTDRSGQRDEGEQRVEMTLLIDAITVFGAGSRVDDALGLVVTHRLLRHARRPSQVDRSHRTRF